MNKLYKQPFGLLKSGLLAMLLFAAVFPAMGQDVVYSETFTQGASYCASSSQFDNWGVMRSQLDTVTKKFKRVTVKGSLNTTGIVCNDPTITQQIAHALRTNTSFSATCNGNSWVVAPGCWGGCGNAAAAVELIVTSTGTCACANPSYIFRPIIGNLNWGGIAGVTCNAPTQLMEVIFSNPVGNNAAPGGLNAPITSCGTTGDSISVIISNLGQNKIANVPVTCQVSGTINGVPYNNTFTTTVGIAPDSIASYTSRNFTFATGLNTSNGADLDFLIYTALSIDTTRSDDTIRLKYKNVGSPTSNPTASNVTRCGSGPATLNATLPSGHIGYWYNSTNQLVKVGNTVNSPTVPGGTTASFFVSSAKSSAPALLSGNYVGSSTQGAGFKSGIMVDVIPKKNITVDSIDIHLSGTGVRQVSVYRKLGTYVGFQTNMGAWTLVGRYSVAVKGFGNPTTIPVDAFELSPGTNALYIYTDDVLRYEASATLDVSDNDLRIFGGQVVRDTFANPVLGNAKFNGGIHYRQSCVSGNRVQVDVIASPLAVGAVIQQGPVYKGKFDAGTPSQPDAVANPDTISYTLLPPTGYSNSNYSTTGSGNWHISSYTVATVNGNPLPAASYSRTNPSSSGNGVFYFHPVSGYSDSTVKLTIAIRRNDNGCDSIIERYIYLAPRPTADYNFTSVCLGDQTDFTNKSTIASGTLEYQWYFGDATTSTFTDPSKFYGAAGNYSVKLVVTSNWNLKDSITKVVDVKQIPQPKFDIENACAGVAVKMTDRSTLPTGTPTYVWEYGDNTANGTGATTSHLYSVPNIYLVTMHVTVNGCSNSISKYATQAPRGTPRFNVSAQVCDNLDVLFKDSSSFPAFGTMGYLYNFGDGNSSSQPVVNHTYNKFQTFTAKLFVRTDLGCLDSATRTVTLKESPKPAFTSTGAPCTNSAVTFTDNSTVPGGTNAYTWEFGDLKTSTLTSPIHSYDAPGTYKIKLTIQNTNGCQGEFEGSYTVTEKPVADFNVDKVCEGGTTEFTNGSIISAGNLTYNWDLGNSTTSTLTNPTVNYATPNTYAVRLIATSSTGCTDTVIKNAVVAANPSAAFNSTSSGWGEGTMKFAGPTGSGLTYNWTFGDGGSSNQQNPNYKYQTPGLWTVKLVVTNADGCRGTSTAQVFVNPVSVEEASKSGIKVYPNPTTGKVVADFSGYTGETITAITITDVLGRVVNNNVSLINGLADINLTGQPTGMYFINVQTENDSKVIKIMLTSN